MSKNNKTCNTNNSNNSNREIVYVNNMSDYSSEDDSEYIPQFGSKNRNVRPTFHDSSDEESD